MKRIPAALAAALLVALLAGCSGGDGGGAGAGEEPTGGAAEGASMTIEDFAFSELTAPPGAEVSVENVDNTTHTVTAEDGSFDVEIAASSTGTFTAPDEPGDYAVTCTIHPEMAGTVTVSE